MSKSASIAYAELLDHAHPLATPPARPELLPAARALFERAHERGALTLQGAWRLHPSEARALDRQTQGATPAGGWHGLASVLAGTGFLKTQERGFMPLRPRDELELWTEQELQRAVIEAFTMRLIPPTTAAGLFLLIGLHPAWGLRVAHETHKALNLKEIDPNALRRPNTLEDEDLFPHPAYATISHAVFACISALLEVLRSLDEGKAYPLDQLAEVILQATRMARRLIRSRGAGGRSRELEPFIDQVTHHLDDAAPRSFEFTLLDLLDNYLVPAGVIQRFNDQSFCVWPEAISPRVRIFGHGTLERCQWLNALVSGEEAGAQLAS